MKNHLQQGTRTGRRRRFIGLVIVVSGLASAFTAVSGPTRAGAIVPSTSQGLNSYEVAFEANTTNLWTVGSDNHGAWHLGMMQGTSPSIARLSNGSYEVAFQANTGQLWIGGPSGFQSTGLGMMQGTSPSITGLSNGGYEVAFQANTSSLWTVGSDNHGDWHLGMMQGTSPSIAGLSNGGYEVAFQANTSSLWLVGSDNHGDRQLGMMPGTSPSITGLSNGGYEVAFQANTSSLWLVGSDNHGDRQLGMMRETSPSIAPSYLPTTSPPAATTPSPPTPPVPFTGGGNPPSFVGTNGQRIDFRLLPGAGCPANGNLTRVTVTGTNQNGARAAWNGSSSNGIGVLTQTNGGDLPAGTGLTNWWWAGEVTVNYWVNGKEYTTPAYVPQVMTPYTGYYDWDVVNDGGNVNNTVLVTCHGTLYWPSGVGVTWPIDQTNSAGVTTATIYAESGYEELQTSDSRAVQSEIAGTGYALVPMIVDAVPPPVEIRQVIGWEDPADADY